MRRKAFSVVVATAITVTALAGCQPSENSDTAVTSDFAQISESLGAELAGYDVAGPGGDGALLQGKLTASAGCVVVELEDGQLVVPIFPKQETTFTQSSAELSWGEGNTAQLESNFEAGGGYVEPSEEGSQLELPESCAGLTSFVIASS